MQMIEILYLTCSLPLLVEIPSTFLISVAVQKPNQVKITDFGLAKLLDIGEGEYTSAGGKVCDHHCYLWQ